MLKYLFYLKHICDIASNITIYFYETNLLGVYTICNKHNIYYYNNLYLIIENSV